MNEHVSSQTQLSHGELGPSWKVVALLGLDDALSIVSAQEQAGTGNPPNTNHLSSVLGLQCWHWILFSGLNWSCYAFFISWKDSVTLSFLSTSAGMEPKKQLSWLTQIVIKGELVVVPDLEDKLRWNLVFCLVQAPEVLLQSCQGKNIYK